MGSDPQFAQGAGGWASPADLVGTVLEGRYDVVRLLGAGGMGAVYEGRHRHLDARVALKVLAPTLAADETQRKRFLREARAANRIEHPNVVEILDFGLEPHAFLVMKFLAGEDLQKHIGRSQQMQWPEVAPIAAQLLAALGAAHEQGVVHRDVKPSNCFLLAKPEGGVTLKVLDFGIAKVAKSSPETYGLTRANELVGTFAYMSPEQAQGKDVDARSDLYAVGVVLYRLLTGELPFRGSNSYQVLDQHVRAEPEPPHTHNPAIPVEVEAAILRAMAKDPGDRFSSAAELAAALEEADESPTTISHLGLHKGTSASAAGLPEGAGGTVVASPPGAVDEDSGTQALTQAVGSSHAPKPTTSPETVPSSREITKPPSGLADAFGRRSASAIYIGIGAGLVLSLVAGVSLGRYLAPASAGSEPTPVSQVPAAAGVDASPLPPPVARLPAPAVDIGDPEIPAPPAEGEPSPEAAPDVVRAPKTKARRRGSSSPKPATPAKSASSVTASLRKQAAARCTTGLVGDEIVVTFHVTPAGGTTLVKPRDPNARSAAGRCVADLVKAATFPAGSSGRRRLSVRPR